MNTEEIDFDLNISPELNLHFFPHLKFYSGFVQDEHLKTEYVKAELRVNIDFNFASEEWRKNKICLKNVTFEYRCGVTMSSGKICKKSVRTCKSAQHIKRRN